MKIWYKIERKQEGGAVWWQSGGKILWGNLCKLKFIRVVIGIQEHESKHRIIKITLFNFGRRQMTRTHQTMNLKQKLKERHRQWHKYNYSNDIKERQIFSLKFYYFILRFFLHIVCVCVSEWVCAVAANSLARKFLFLCHRSLISSLINTHTYFKY